MSEGTLAKWYKNIGDTIEKGDHIADVETDKATQEVESFHAGVLLYRGVEEGKAIPVKSIMAIIGKAGEDFSALLGGAAKPTTVAEKPAEQTATAEKQVAETTAVAAPAAAVSTETTAENGRVKASPLAKNMASVSGVDISKIEGSGDSGRIVRRDVEAFLSQKPAEKAVSAPVSTVSAASIRSPSSSTKSALSLANCFPASAILSSVSR